MPSINKIFKNSGIILLGQIAGLLLNLVATIQISRYLLEENFGIFSFSLVVLNYLSILPNMGLKPIIVREISRNKEKAFILLGNSVILRTVLTIMAIIIGCFFAKMSFDSKQIFAIIILSFNLLWSSKTIALRNSFEHIFESRLEMFFPILFKLIDAVLLLVFLNIAFFFKFGFHTILIIYTVSSIPGFILTTYLSHKKAPLALKIDTKIIKTLITEAWPLAVYILFSNLYSFADVFFLKFYTNNASVGYYSAAFRLIYPMNFIPNAIVMSTFPLISVYFTNDKDRLNFSSYFCIKLLGLIGLAFAIILTFFNKEIITLLYTANYAPAAIPLMILSWAELFVFLNFFLVDLHTAIDRQKLNTLAALIMIISNILTSIILIPKYGIIGAGLAKFVTSFSGFLILTFYIHKTININLNKIMIKLAIIGVVCSLFIYYFKPLNLIFTLIMSPFLFILLIPVTKLYNKREYNLINQTIKNLKHRFSG